MSDVMNEIQEEEGQRSNARAALSDRIDDFSEALGMLFIRNNASGRNKFREKWPGAAEYLFGAELISYDNEGASDRLHRKKLEEEAGMRRIELKKTIAEIEDKSVKSGALVFEYVGEVIDKYGSEISILLYEKNIIERVRPGLLAERTAELERRAKEKEQERLQQESLIRQRAAEIIGEQSADTGVSALPVSPSLSTQAQPPSIQPESSFIEKPQSSPAPSSADFQSVEESEDLEKKIHDQERQFLTNPTADEDDIGHIDENTLIQNAAKQDSFYHEADDDIRPIETPIPEDIMQEPPETSFSEDSAPAQFVPGYKAENVPDHITPVPQPEDNERTEQQADVSLSPPPSAERQPPSPEQQPQSYTSVSAIPDQIQPLANIKPPQPLAQPQTPFEMDNQFDKPDISPEMSSPPPAREPVSSEPPIARETLHHTPQTPQQPSQQIEDSALSQEEAQNQDSSSMTENTALSNEEKKPDMFSAEMRPRGQALPDDDVDG